MESFQLACCRHTTTNAKLVSNMVYQLCIAGITSRVRPIMLGKVIILTVYLSDYRLFNSQVKVLCKPELEAIE